MRKRLPFLVELNQWLLLLDHGKMIRVFYHPLVQGCTRNVAATSPSNPV